MPTVKAVTPVKTPEAYFEYFRAESITGDTRYRLTWGTLRPDYHFSAGGMRSGLNDFVTGNGGSGLFAVDGAFAGIPSLEFDVQFPDFGHAHGMYLEAGKRFIALVVFDAPFGGFEHFRDSLHLNG
jgi:hypothetical protein